MREVPGLEINNFSTLSLITLSKTNPYLTGLIEGDESIIVPNKPKSPSG